LAESFAGRSGGGIALDHDYGTFQTSAIGGNPPDGAEPPSSRDVDPFGDIDVLVNGQFQGAFLPTGHIAVYGNGGKDTIRLGGSFAKGQPVARIGVPAFLFCDGGNDILDVSGSSANNVLVAGNGMSTLIGGAGRDILIGGPQSTFRNGKGDDLIIKGVTPFNNDIAALDALMAEWGRAGSDDGTRIKHLIHGGGLNGDAVLSIAVLARAPAHNTLLATPLELLQPALIAPKGLLAATMTTPTFTWSPLTVADHYHLSVDDITAKQQALIRVDVAGTTWTPTTLLLQGHSYSWWIQTCDALGNSSLPSRAVQFRIAPLAAPAPTAPAGALPATSVSPTFHWRAVSGADHYELEVDDVTKKRARVLHDANVTAMPWTAGIPLSPGDTYRWRVRALGPGPAPGPWSSYTVFSIAAPSTEAKPSWPTGEQTISR
jgi:hypothetical protein